MKNENENKTKNVKDVYLYIAIAVIVIVTIAIIAIAFAIKGNNNGNSQIRSGSTNEEFTVYDNEGTKVNISDKLKESKEIEGLSLSNIQLTENNGQTTLIVYVTNNTTNEFPEPFDVNLVLLDKEGQTIVTLPAIIPSLKPEETKSFSSSITEDCSNAYDFRIERTTSTPAEPTAE